MREKSRSFSIKTMVLVAIMTALVVILQLLGSFIRLGVFSISLVLIPIVIGAAICGVWAGAWLGLAFGITVLLSGDAAAFLVINPFGTVVTVLLKGALAGLTAGLAYKCLSICCTKLLEKRTVTDKKWLDKTVEITLKFIPVLAAALVCPVVNTGIFLVGCRVFFYETIAAWGAARGYANAAEYMFVGLAGINFLVELVTNALLAPVVVRLLAIKNKIFKF